MPNYIKNRIEILGTKEQVEEVTNKFSTLYPRKQKMAYDDRFIYLNKETNSVGWFDAKTGEFEERNKEKTKQIPEGFKQDFDEAWTQFPDFNKIIEMPESLHIEIHSGIETAVEVALKMKASDNALLASLEMMSRDKFKSPLEFNDKEWEQYITCLNNVKKYGFIYWYDWAIEKWGTKWNCCECEKINDNTFDFVTAWSGVPNLIELMSKELPKIKFIYEWSDEDTGSNCGTGIYLNGEIELKRLKNGSREAYELAFKLRPNYKENYKLVGENYEYIEEE